MMSAPPVTPRALPLWLLLLVTGLAGTVMLVLQIVGARFLSPYFGSTHFTWTNQIAVTLLAIALGNYAGGRLADRSLSPLWPALGLLGAGAYTCLTLAVSEKAFYFFLRAHVLLGGILASCFFFLVPLLLLAMVGPFAIRSLTAGISGLGTRAGGIMAVSTAGSVAGALLAGFCLIPSLTNIVSLYGAALVLLALGLLVLAASHTSGRLLTGALAGAAIAATIGGLGVHQDLRPRVAFGDEIARHSSGYSLLLVNRNPRNGYRYLVDNFTLQSSWHPEKNLCGSMYAYSMLKLADLYATRMDNVLVIGLGGGFIASSLAEQAKRVDGVEIHPGIADLSTRYFGLDPQKVNLHIGDGRYFMRQAKGPYDVVVLDAFNGDAMPSHLMTREAFQEIRDLLAPEGVLVINCLGDLKEGSFFLASLEKTLRSVFREAYAHDPGQGNFFFVAGNRQPFEFTHPPDYADVNPLVADLVRAAVEHRHEITDDSAIVLTDDFNPVDFYDARFRMGLRARGAWNMYRKDE